MLVTKIPRQPFLGHSELLLCHLLRQGGDGFREVLEIGCGPASPLTEVFHRHWPEVRLHQIDARADVIPLAAEANPLGQVERMMAHDMSSIPAGSKDVVIAMSVYDQNAADGLPQIAAEIHRVLAPGGLAIYLHNEELNPPATSASMLYRSFAPLTLHDEPRLMLPSDQWQPTNDLEYCTGRKADIEQVVRQLGPEADVLKEYVCNLHPGLAPPTQQTDPASGKSSMPYYHRCTVPLMSQIRNVVAYMRQVKGLVLRDHATSELIADKVERQMFTAAQGFELLTAGVFEQRTRVNWQDFFREPLGHTCAVRGITKFGYLADQAPPPVTAYCQDLNCGTDTSGDAGDTMLVGYQYGMVGRKC